MSSPLTPGEVVDAIIAGRARGDLDTSLQYVAETSIDQGEVFTRQDWRTKWERIVAGVPDWQITLENSVETGEWVCNRYTISGTHTGDFFGRPPTGRRFRINAMDMVRVRDGQLIEHWAFGDSF
ncbi:ester cyclase [Fodinicola acaciae]|uniref:ester cyclase n=1 Tax=Fodinicola acaciae TaxID=2681555 RepID=UPI0013D7F895|nr:ester cyclase [Fodinicola acaciae]